MVEITKSTAAGSKEVTRKIYRVIKDGKVVETEVKGEYGGNRRRKIFGKLDCKTGMRMQKEHRVFFATLADAVKAGYRPCNNCKPIGENEFSSIKHLVRENGLYDFYHRNSKLRRD